MLLILYDGECPFCSDYIARLKLKAHCGPVTLINAREPSPVVSAYWQAGFDLDQGMVAVLDGNPFYGAKAVALLAELANPDNVFNRLNQWLFSHPSLSEALYPLFKRARRITLAMKGIGPLRPR
jgi:predicted DCC family thiol-disulfide oxidoreductase YuxK